MIQLRNQKPKNTRFDPLTIPDSEWFKTLVFVTVLLTCCQVYAAVEGYTDFIDYTIWIQVTLLFGLVVLSLLEHDDKTAK